MLLLACEYRHVHEQQQGCITLPFLSVGETEAQWMVPQGVVPSSHPVRRLQLP